MTPHEILEEIPKLSALVVGDICLDRWCTYDPATSEPSRETGIPRIGVVRTEVTAGAGGTVANNLAALGCGRVAVLGAIGNDGFATELSRALAERNITDLCIRAEWLQTFTYTKVINGDTGVEDQPRLDFINARPLPEDVERAVIAQLRTAVEAYDVILVADQAETSRGGVITAPVRETIADLALLHPGKIFFADSRARIQHFRNVIAKPNQQEGEAACRELFGLTDYSALRTHLAARLLLVTHGGDGVLLVDRRGESWVHTQPEPHPVDICGAGDSFSAGSSLALAAGASPAEAAEFGNLVASITIMKKGTGTASPAEVRAKCTRLP
jgi:rfaE bifunctional protein kinase chain/domain